MKIGAEKNSDKVKVKLSSVDRHIVYLLVHADPDTADQSNEMNDPSRRSFFYLYPFSVNSSNYFLSTNTYYSMDMELIRVKLSPTTKV